MNIADLPIPDNRVDFTVTRIDLEVMSAVVVYSDLTNPDDFDKIGETADWQFSGNKIIMPKLNEEKFWDTETEPANWRVLKRSAAVNICTLDMRNYDTMAEIDNERIWLNILYLYDGDIYCATGEKGLSRIDTETGKREFINGGILYFCIDGDFLYYTNPSNGALYRVLLDYTRVINFDTAVEVYAADANYSLENWKVHNGNLYADIRTVFGVGRKWDEGELPDAGRYKIKLDSQEQPYLFYKYK